MYHILGFFHICSTTRIAPWAYGAHDCGMVAPRQQPLNRGMSVLAAFVFVSILGWTVLALSATLPQQGPQAMVAATEATQAQPTSQVPPQCSTIKPGSKVTVLKAADAPKQPCVCQELENNLRIFKSIDYAVRARLQSGNAVAETTRTVGVKVSGTQSKCKVKYLDPSGKEVDLLTATPETLNGLLRENTEKAAKEFPTFIAQSTLDGKTLNLGPMSAETRSSILNAFQELKAGDERNSDWLKGPEYGEHQLVSAEDQIKNFKICGEASCTDAEVNGTKEGPATPPVLNKDLTDSVATPPDDRDLAWKACQQNPAPYGCPGGSAPTPKPGTQCPGGNCSTGFGDGSGNGNSGGSGGAISALGSFLSGLSNAFRPTPPQPQTAPPQACATDPNAYAQQQQQYQQQLQQYNYQLQMYNQQQQQASIYGTPAPIAPAQPTACTPSTGHQCQAQPQQPPASACSAGSWRATYSGVCVTGWQCISTAGPKAELSCEPQVADVGQTLAITYGCSSGVASSSSFKVTTQPGGSATTTVKAPPQGTNTATYTLACTDNGKTTGAQCSVQVARTNIIFVANPKTVPANGTSLLSWLTTGMQSCVISSPDQADFTARNSSNTSVTGAATTSAIATSAQFLLHCETLSGGVRDATMTVSVTP